MLEWSPTTTFTLGAACNCNSTAHKTVGSTGRNSLQLRFPRHLIPIQLTFLSVVKASAFGRPGIAGSFIPGMTFLKNLPEGG